MLRLKNLKVKACRGIIDGPELHFESGGLLLCGSNGMGKSSFIDAIEKVLTGKCSSLDTGDQSISWTKYGTHIESKKPPEIEITLTDGNKDESVKLDTHPPTIDKNIQTFLTVATQHSFILRRRTLLNFIDAKPQERYKAVEGFLNLDKFTAFEVKLKELVDAGQAKLLGAQDNKRQNETTLRTQLKLGPSVPITEATCLAQVNPVLAQAGLAPIASFGDVQKRLTALKTLLAPFSNMDSLQKVQTLMQKVKEIPNVSEILTAGHAYAKARQDFLDEEAKLKGHFYAEVLEKGLAWIKEDSLEQCPLCGNQIEIADVAVYVTKRLAENQRLTELRGIQSRAQIAFINGLTDHQGALNKVKDLWKDTLCVEFPNNMVIESINALVKSHAELLPHTAITNDTDDLTKADLDAITKSLEGEVESKKVTFPDSDRYTNLYNANSYLITVAVYLSNIEIAVKEIDRVDRALIQIKRITTLAEQGRKNTVQKLMNRIAGVADGYFRAIHPNESIGSPTLKVTDRGTGSISLTSEFYGKEGDPRGRYSEGHVDSLGLCLFLAIRRLHHNQRPELSLLILDDVLHSVDGDHRRTTANLIFEEFKDHQLIITTHDPLWFENLKAAARKYFPGRKFTQHRIANWTIKTGPAWGDHLSDYEWLLSPEGVKTKPADRLIKAGRLLEEMLQNLCDSMDLPVPFRIKGDYTIDPLWNAFFKAAKNNKEFLTVAAPHLNRVEDLRNLRNWVGAHWNEWAIQLTDAESRDFSDAVIALRNSVYCPQCEEFIMRIVQLEGVWSCKGEHKKFNKELTSTPKN